MHRLLRRVGAAVAQRRCRPRTTGRACTAALLQRSLSSRVLDLTGSLSSAGRAASDVRKQQQQQQPQQQQQQPRQKPGGLADPPLGKKRRGQAKSKAKKKKQQQGGKGQGRARKNSPLNDGGQGSELTSEDRKRRLCEQHRVLPAPGEEPWRVAVRAYAPSRVEAARNAFARCSFVTSVATEDQLPASSSLSPRGDSAASASSAGVPGSAPAAPAARRSGGGGVGRVGSVALAGRSNVGKSTLLNAVLRHKGLARASKTPGRTQMLNFFQVRGSAGLWMTGAAAAAAAATTATAPGASPQHCPDGSGTGNDGDADDLEAALRDMEDGSELAGDSAADADAAAVSLPASPSPSDPVLHVVDLPGYGFARAPPAVVRQWTATMRQFIRDAPALNVREVLVLVDARHGLLRADTEFIAGTLCRPRSGNSNSGSGALAGRSSGSDGSGGGGGGGELELLVPYSIVLTKADKVPLSKLRRRVADTLACFAPPQHHAHHDDEDGGGGAVGAGGVAASGGGGLRLPPPRTIHVVASRKRLGVDALRAHILALVQPRAGGAAVDVPAE